MHPQFSHIDTWIFDLDLTLYAPDANIMAQVRDRIALFVPVLASWIALIASSGLSPRLRNHAPTTVGARPTPAQQWM